MIWRMAKRSPSIPLPIEGVHFVSVLELLRRLAEQIFGCEPNVLFHIPGTFCPYFFFVLVVLSSVCRAFEIIVCKGDVT